MKVKKILVYLVISIVIFGIIARMLLKTKAIKGESGVGFQIIIIFLVLTTILSFVSLGISYKSVPELKKIDIIPGESGESGSRGDKGDSANPLEACNDDMCFRKIMDHITNVINLWSNVSGISPLPEGTYIKNKYLQGKVKEMCDSPELKEILKKNGAHKKNFRGNFIDSTKSCEMDKDCGAYDYIFQKWTEWILIILKYKNGKEFIDSPLLTENEFNNMIDETDFKKNEETTDKWVFTSKNELGGTNNSTQTIGTILLSLPNGEIYKELNEKQKKIFNEKAAVYKKFITSPFYKFYPTEGVPSAYQIKDSNNTLDFEDKLTYKGFLSPFEEIKKYDAWYWGSEEMSSPRLINRCEFLDTIPENYKNVLKIKLTNTYTPLWSSEKDAQIKTQSGRDMIYTDNQQFGSSKIHIYRPKEFVDNNEKDLFFKNYKPVGDIIINKTSNNNLLKTDIEQIMPIANKYKYIDLNIPFTSSGPVYFTILVSGDVKTPINYKLIRKVERKEGFDKNKKSFSVWRPVAPEGYVALGDVIDVGADSAKPDLNAIYCIPVGSVSVLKNNNNNIKPLWNSTSVKKNTNDFYTDMENVDDFSIKASQYLAPINELKQIYNNLEFNENDIKYKKEITKYLAHYNTFRAGAATDSQPFYEIQEKSMFFNEKKLKTNKTEIITKNKNPIRYSILNIYNL